MQSTADSLPDRSAVIEIAMRMVVPMRHEFGQNININRVLEDNSYAKSIVELASSSKNEQVRQYAQYLARTVLGPRTGAAPAPAAGSAPAAAGAPVEEDAKRRNDQRLGRYTGGLR